MRIPGAIMGKLTDIEIRGWTRPANILSGRADGDGLYLCFREATPARHGSFAIAFARQAAGNESGQLCGAVIADARKTAKEMAARVSLGYDVAGEKQERKREAVAKIEDEKNAWTVAKLADEYFERTILGRWKHPNIVRSRIENDIKPAIGKMKAEDVRPRDIDAMMQTVVKRGAPTVANDVLRWSKRIFDFGIKRQVIEINPASAFDPSDAGGKEEARDRWLTRDEIIKLFQAMRDKAGTFTIENALRGALAAVAGSPQRGTDSGAVERV